MNHSYINSYLSILNLVGNISKHKKGYNMYKMKLERCKTFIHNKMARIRVIWSKCVNKTDSKASDNSNITDNYYMRVCYHNISQYSLMRERKQYLEQKETP